LNPEFVGVVYHKKRERLSSDDANSSRETARSKVEKKKFGTALI
jgi:hypothetical protein